MLASNLSPLANQATATELARDLARVRERLRDGPVEITSHGRTEMVLLSAHEYEQMVRLADTDAERLEAKLETVMETVEEMVVILNDQLEIRRANSMFCDYFGFRRTEVLGRPIAGFSRTASDQFVVARCREVLKSGRQEKFELPSSHRRNRMFSYTVRPWPMGVILFARDVTARSHADDRLSSDMALDRSIEEIEGVATCVINRSGTIVGASRSLAKLFGGKVEGLRGSLIFSFFAPDARADFDTVLENTVGGTSILEADFLRRGTDYRTAIVALTPFHSKFEQACFALAMKLKD